MLAAPKGHQEPWILHGCVVFVIEVFEYISVWWAVGVPRPRG